MIGNNITCLESGEKGWRYASDFAIYTERLIDGRLIGANYLDNGIPIFDYDEEKELTAFDLVIDGEAMYYGWEFADFQSEMNNDGISAGILTLKHTAKPVKLKITTWCSGYGFFKRTMEITNTSDAKVMALTSVVPLRGKLWRMSENIMENLKDNSVVPYSVGHFKDVDWSYEGNFEWQNIPLNTKISYGSTGGRSGFNSPFFVLHNHLYGGYFVCQLGWSSNWEMSLYNDFSHWSGIGVSLNFSIMPVCTPPVRVIEPGETIKVPEVHFGLSHEVFDTAIQNLHAYQRKCVLRKVGDGIQPVMHNNWGFMQHEVSEEKLIKDIDIASEIGAEVYIIDAGWFGGKGSSWYDTVGDWYTAERLPNDLFGVFKYARSKGLKCGLWVEIESAGSQSKIAAEHPEWFITRYGKKVERVLDLSKPEVKSFLQEEVFRLIEKYKLDLFRLDSNSGNYNEGGFNQRNGLTENTLWRDVEALYEIFDKVKERYPDLMLENCAGGGGRTDIGIMSRFTTTQSSDMAAMPRTVRILNGLSMALPPDYTSKFLGINNKGSYRGNADTMMHAVIMAHPVISGITPELALANPALMDCVKKYIKIYKDFIRTFHREARVYHHTPVIPGADGTGWCALEYASQDKRKAVAAVFRLVNAGFDVYHLKFRGVDEGLEYTVQIEPGEKTFTVSGYSLANEGIDIRLDAALTSKMFLLTAIV